VKAEWSDPKMWDKLLAGVPFKVRAPKIQIPP